MQTFLIYFCKPGKFDDPFHDPMYYQSYRAFAQYCLQRDTKLLFARGNSYLGNMKFANGWEFIGQNIESVTETITADCVYRICERPPFIQKPGELFLNSLDFSSMIDDKWHTYELFGEFMPTSFQITAENWREVADKITTNQIVLKPVHGGGGKGIVITDTNTFDFPSLNITQPYIAQNFIDSSGGIPGVCTGYHDIRIMFFNDEPKLSYLRAPKTGSLLSNISQGASAVVVEMEQIPTAIMDMARAVDSRYRQYVPRHYTTDFFMDRDGRPYLVETNTQPGFPRLDAEGSNFQAKYYQYLFELLNQAIIDHRTER